MLHFADDANTTTALDTKSSSQDAATCSKENDPCENVEKGKGNNVRSGIYVLIAIIHYSKTFKSSHCM